MSKIRYPAFLVMVAAIGLLLAVSIVDADNHGQTTPSPGFRPETENSAALIESLGSAKVAVFPSLVRRESRTAHSFSSQKLAVSMLNGSGLLEARPANRRMDLGDLQRVSQWDLFQYGLRSVGEQLAAHATDADYLLVLEFLVPDNQNVFGIECYIVDRNGQNVFSFLLNSHHEMFVEAGLHAKNSSEDAREAMLLEATRIAIKAFEQQLEAVRKQGSAQAAPAEPVANAAADTAEMRIVIITRLHQRLMHVFMHSFKHSIISGFESNGVNAQLQYTTRDSNDLSQFEQAIDDFAADAIVQIDIDPLFRRRKDGYEAIVGTEFKVTMMDRTSGDVIWKMADSVDYIRMFGPRYVAHVGILKEFAWHTTAAIVSRFMQDVYGTESARVYTVTEDRERHGQRTD